jgi:hypothetical protein
MTYAIHASKNGQSVVTVRISPEAAVPWCGRPVLGAFGNFLVNLGVHHQWSWLILDLVHKP